MDGALTLIYFPTAVALGALHALEPGHAKTLTAAYLIGTNGTRRDALLLGLSVATTHSIVVIALSLAALILGRNAIAAQAGHWLQVASSVLVVGLGVWMLVRRWPRKRHLSHGRLEHNPQPVGHHAHSHDHAVQQNAHSHDHMHEQHTHAHSHERHAHAHNPEHHVHSHIHGDEPTTEHAHDHSHDHSRGHAHDAHYPHEDEDAHTRAHVATLPDYVGRGERPNAWQVIAFGAAGGMIPCTAAVSVMLLAISAGKTWVGILTVFGFSIGLAATLVTIGMMVVAGLNRVSALPRLSKLGRHAPILSAMLVIVSGIVALFLAH